MRIHESQYRGVCLNSASLGVRRTAPSLLLGLRSRRSSCYLKLEESLGEAGRGHDRRVVPARGGPPADHGRPGTLGLRSLSRKSQLSVTSWSKP